MIIVPEKKQAHRLPQYCNIIHKMVRMTIKAFSNIPETCMYDLREVLKGFSHIFINLVVLIVYFVWITWFSLSASCLLPCPDFIPNLLSCTSASVFLSPSRVSKLFPHSRSFYVYTFVCPHISLLLTLWFLSCFQGL